MDPEAEDQEVNKGLMNSDHQARSARSKWGSGIEGKLALLASVVSPFDYTTIPLYFYYNGGGLVVLPILLLFLTLVGFPMLVLEVAVGQFMARGTWCAFNIAPLFKGVGYLLTITNSQLVIFWFWHLMSQVLFCYDLGMTPTESVSIFSHCADAAADSGDSGDYVDPYGDYMNVTADSPCYAENRWSDRWLEFSYSPSSQGLMEWDGAMVVAMFFAILLVCGIVGAGTRLIGKLSAVCVLVPYLLTLMLCVRVLTVPGAAEGLKIGFWPKFYSLANGHTWTRCSMLALYSLSSGQGMAMTAASYNRFNNNFLVDCGIVFVVKIVMIIVISLTTLGAFGVVAEAQNVSMDHIITGGLNAVPAITEAFLVNMPGGGFWAACFLICILLTSLIAAVWTVETAVTAVRDLLPITPRFRTLRKKYVLVAVFGVPWLFYSVFYCTKGSYAAIMQMQLSLAGDFSLLLVCFLECAAVGWLYGPRRFQANMAAMCGGLCGCPFPLIFWTILTPLILFVMLIVNLVFVSLEWQLQALVAFVFSLLLILISGTVLLATRRGTLRQKWRIMTTPWDLAPHQMQPQYRRYETIAMTTVPN